MIIFGGSVGESIDIFFIKKEKELKAKVNALKNKKLVIEEISTALKSEFIINEISFDFNNEIVENTYVRSSELLYGQYVEQEKYKIQLPFSFDSELLEYRPEEFHIPEIELIIHQTGKQKFLVGYFNPQIGNTLNFKHKKDNCFGDLYGNFCQINIKIHEWNDKLQNKIEVYFSQ